MKTLPPTPNIDQLKRQAKELLSAVQAGAPEAVARFHAALPAAKGQTAETLAALRLHDAQSCIAREYGFASWAALRDFVDMALARSSDPAKLARDFTQFCYAGGIADGMNRPQPERAARYLGLLVERGPLDPWIACAAGDVAVVQAQLARDPAWIAKPDGPLALPPLIAATHSALVHLPEYKDGIHQTVAALLDAGADPNQSIGSRWPPASVAEPSRHPLSALYGAAGGTHDADLTRILLDAGANPNDGESLYHALEGPDPGIVHMLLDAGAVVDGTNALFHALDFDDVKTFRLLLSKADALDDPAMGRLLHWAIKRRRSAAHIEAILEAGGATDGAYAMALHHGLPEIAAALDHAGAAEDLSEADLFLAACARADADEARRLQAANPGFPTALSDAQLKMFPELAAAGCAEAVLLMADLGWPLDVKGGDWEASVLNQAVFRGDAALTKALLERGSRWTEEHGFGDNACGTLCWASLNQPEPDGDWVGCAQALVAHGMPGATRDPAHPETVLVGGDRRHFSDDVTEYLLSVGT